MLEIIEVFQDHEGHVPEAPYDGAGAHGANPLVLAVAIVALVVASAVAFWPSSEAKPALADDAATTATFEVTLACGGADTACYVATTAPDGSQWYWLTDIGRTVPDAWWSDRVEGQLRVESDWGTATFTSDGQTLPVTGGRVSPEHSPF